MKSGTGFLFAFILALLTAATYSSAEEDDEYSWQLKKEHKRMNIQVYLRKRDGFEYKSFLAVTEVDAPLPAIIALFNDVEHTTEWVHRVSKMQILERISEWEMYQQVVTSAPPPVKDRDAILHTRVVQNPSTGIIRITSKSAPDDYYPEEDGLVRMPDVNTVWRFIPLSENRTRVEFEGYGDPGGILPVWLVNMVLHQSPYYTMKRMHRELRKDEYLESKEFEEFAWKPAAN